MTNLKNEPLSNLKSKIYLVEALRKISQDTEDFKTLKSINEELTSLFSDLFEIQKEFEAMKSFEEKSVKELQRLQQESKDLIVELELQKSDLNKKTEKQNKVNEKLEQIQEIHYLPEEAVLNLLKDTETDEIQEPIIEQQDPQLDDVKPKEIQEKPLISSPVLKNGSFSVDDYNLFLSTEMNKILDSLSSIEFFAAFIANKEALQNAFDRYKLPEKKSWDNQQYIHDDEKRKIIMNFNELNNVKYISCSIKRFNNEVIKEYQFVSSDILKSMMKVPFNNLKNSQKHAYNEFSRSFNKYTLKRGVKNYWLIQIVKEVDLIQRNLESLLKEGK